MIKINKSWGIRIYSIETYSLGIASIFWLVLVCQAQLIKEYFVFIYSLAIKYYNEEYSEAGWPTQKNFIWALGLLDSHTKNIKNEIGLEEEHESRRGLNRKLFGLSYAWSNITHAWLIILLNKIYF